MTHRTIIRIVLTTLICSVWFVNGFFCKILNFVPRHQHIVSRILGEEYAWLVTMSIGMAEILLTAWILSGVRSRFCALFQMVIIAVMNVLEFFRAPDLLLFGRMNIVFASLFILVIYANEFMLQQNSREHSVIN